MNEEVEQEEFDDEDAEALLEADVEVDIELDQELRELERSRRKGAKNPDPAWRKLERLREERRTAELIMDFEDYDIGVDGDEIDDMDDDADTGADDDLQEIPLRQAASS